MSSLLSTILAFALVPLVKKPDEDKEKIAALEAEVARLGEEKDAWARAYEAQSQRLQARLDEERERGILDRQQTRHWRAQCDYWQQAYASLAIPNQWAGANRYSQAQSGYQQHALGQQAQQQGQQLAQQMQNLGQGPIYENVGWLCTCVPDRATALSRAQPGEAVRVDNVTLARLDLPPRDTDG